jgi:hypothetical protein
MNKESEKKFLLTNRVTAILYFVCAICWLITGLSNLDGKTHNIVINFGLTVVFIVLGILYLVKDKKNK